LINVNNFNRPPAGLKVLDSNPSADTEGVSDDVGRLLFARAPTITSME
jgi:hypothetical protein